MIFLEHARRCMAESWTKTEGTFPGGGIMAINIFIDCGTHFVGRVFEEPEGNKKFDSMYPSGMRLHFDSVMGNRRASGELNATGEN